MNLYEQTALRIATLIERGTLRPGDRIPSVRRLSRDAGVSPATVVRAYEFLEQRGLVEARPQSGYYVRHAVRAPAALPTHPTPRRQPTRVDVSDFVCDVLDAIRDPDLVPLGSPFPAPELFPLATLNRTLASVARRAEPASVLRDLPPGHPELRRQIALRCLQSGMGVTADDVVVTSGAMEALNIALRTVAQAGDAIAIESPCFFGILQAIEHLGMRAIEVATDAREGIDLGELAKLLDRHPIRACMLMTNFQHPLGGVMPDAKKRDLVALLERHDVPLVEDDVYADLHFAAQRPLPAKAFDRKGIVLHCASFSKSLAPGYRVGWAAPGRYRERFARLKFASSLTTASLMQAAIAEYLGANNPERSMRAMRRTLMAQLATVSDAVERAFPPGTRMTRPEGGYQLWVELPPDVDALALFRLALAQGISIAPGPMFSAQRGLRNYVRLNYGRLVDTRTLDAIDTLGRMARALT